MTIMRAKCGTYAGWNDHRRRDDTPCEACKQAHATYIRDWRRRRGATTSTLVPLDLLEQAAGQCNKQLAERLRACIRSGR